VTEGDDLFEYLEREIKNVLAKVILGNIRATYLKFMTEIGPSHGKLKLDALYDSQPDFDPATANMMAQVQVAADGIMLAVAIQLAQTESP
jgi:hypothetical protein